MKNKKYIYHAIFIFNIVNIICSSSLFSKTILVLPEKIELEEVNKNTNKKLVNKYKNEDQLENQYKGKLKYKPDNDGLNMYRSSRFYTSVYFLPKGFLLEKIDDFNINSKSNISYSVVAGYYFTNNIALEIDYSELIYSVSNINIDNLTKFKMHSRNYILDITAESNYSRFIPFISLGLGIMQSTFSESNIENIKNNITMAYQIVGGFEIAFTDSFLISLRYKFLQPVKGIKLQYNNDSHRIKFKKIGDFTVGLKYVW